MSKKLSARVRRILRAEKRRAQIRAESGAPGQGNLLSNPNPTPSSKKSGPGGSPLYNSQQDEMVENPTHKRNQVAKPPGRAKRDQGAPTTAPLYDANQTDLTDVGNLDGKPQDKLKGARAGRIGVIERIRRHAAQASRG